MSNNQNEYNKALQNLLAMSGKKAEIKKVWENASPGSDFVEQILLYAFLMKDFSKTFIILFFEI